MLQTKCGLPTFRQTPPVLEIAEGQGCHQVGRHPTTIDGAILNFSRKYSDRANMTESDLCGKLCEANALNLHQIIAVVFESTVDVSVIVLMAVPLL